MRLARAKVGSWGLAAFGVQTNDIRTRPHMSQKKVKPVGAAPDAVCPAGAHRVTENRETKKIQRFLRPGGSAGATRTTQTLLEHAPTSRSHKRLSGAHPGTRLPGG